MQLPLWHVEMYRELKLNLHSQLERFLWLARSTIRLIQVAVGKDTRCKASQIKLLESSKSSFTLPGAAVEHLPQASCSSLFTRFKVEHVQGEIVSGRKFAINLTSNSNSQPVLYSYWRSSCSWRVRAGEWQVIETFNWPFCQLWHTKTSNMSTGPFILHLERMNNWDLSSPPSTHLDKCQHL